ncbi:hypothetical protein HOD20_01205 [archaeon]|mgnify:CR=1 FL=1|jgi:NAD+ kinase|nr:hypothetical protein [archaeon]MBT4351121.1 hypothetical protein [archaeon]MBT4648075.1 hypothetical protein [archaeon]MBT6822513.1 hypothetical protein [archaeon]MBT7392514.1 hypothetical protein [archaeon]
MKNFLIIFYDDNNHHIISSIKTTLDNNSLNYDLYERTNLKKELFLKRDCIIVIGGDGTFLRTSHFVKNIPMIGINSNPKKKEGFLMHGNVDYFKIIIESIVKNNYGMRKLIRLRCKINDKEIEDIALNDFYIGPKTPYYLYNYDIKIGNIKELQRSSGILVSTPAGTTAWINSAGGVKMNLDSTKYQYLIREPYTGNLMNKYKLKNGILNKNQKITLFSRCDSGIVVADSVSCEYNLKKGDKVEISVSKDYLNYVDIS